MKVLFFANTDWYLYNFRLPLAKAIRRQGGEVVLVSPPGDYAAKLMSEGFRWIPVLMHRKSLNPLRELKFIVIIISLFRKERPDLVHNFTIKCVIYGTVAAKFARIPACVNAIAGMGYTFTSKTILARLLKFFVKFFLKIVLKLYSSRLIFQNPDDLACVISFAKIHYDRVRLIRGSGVNTSRFIPLKKDCLIKREAHSCEFKVLLATRLLWEKGIKEYVEAARIVKKSSAAQIEFLLAGSPDQGNPSAVPLPQIFALQAEGVIKYLGRIEQMEKLLPQVDLCVLPTSYGEGVPRILIEAAASGLPIVATNVPGCREIVRHGVNGLLVPVQDSIALADAIMQLIEKPSDMIRMGEAGRKIAVSEFDEELVIRETLSVYKESLAKFDISKK